MFLLVTLLSLTLRNFNAHLGAAASSSTGKLALTSSAVFAMMQQVVGNVKADKQDLRAWELDFLFSEPDFEQEADSE